MVKKISLVDYSLCHPDQCDRGICKAALACPYKILKQEAPFEIPDLNQAMCMGCSECETTCPLKAIRVEMM